MQGVSTRKMEKLARSLGIESLSRSQVSEMTKGLNEQVNAFRSRSLSQCSYPILWVDALYEKVRMDGRIVSMAVLVVCGVDEHGQRDILAIEPMLEESEEVYLQLFRGLQERGLCTPRPVVSDAHAGLVAAIRNRLFPGGKLATVQGTFHAQYSGADSSQGQRYLCPERISKTIWLAPTREQAHRLAEEICRQYEHRFPKAVRCLGEGLEDSLSFYAFPQLDPRKISSTNVLERLNREIRRRTGVVEDISQCRCLHQAGYHISHGIRRRLVCLQSVPQRAVCSSHAATGSLTFYFTGTLFANNT